MKIYTKTGDTGETSLLGGERVRKDHHRIEAYGTIDELNSHVGVVRAGWIGGPIDAELAAIQSDLFDIGALLASAVPNEQFCGVREARIEALERAIDTMEAELAPLKNFVLPGGSPDAAAMHVARTVCRRSERMVVALGEPGEDTSRATRYLNRLSDFLFVAARYANHVRSIDDVAWHPK